MGRVVIWFMLAGLLISGNLEAVGKKGGGDIFSLIKSGDVAGVKAMIDKNPRLVNTKDKSGRYPLHHACSGKQKELVKFLLEKGADVNVKSQRKNTPLNEISESKDCFEIAKMLIENGADINADEGSFGPPFSAVKDVKLAKLLIEKGADVKARNRNGFTPLHSIRNREIAEFLLAHGAGCPGEGRGRYDSFAYGL